MSDERSRTYTWQDPLPNVKKGLRMDGLSYMQAYIRGEMPNSPIAETMGFTLTKAEKGYALFEGEPQEFHYNPIGVVHGGFASTLLDSALGCCVHTTLEQGIGYTTLQLNINLVRAIALETGNLQCEGHVIHAGRQMATAEATIKDMDGKLYAHGTTTCLIFPLKG